MLIIEVDIVARVENGNSIADQAAHQLITDIKVVRPNWRIATQLVAMSRHLGIDNRRKRSPDSAYRRGQLSNGVPDCYRIIPPSTPSPCGTTMLNPSLELYSSRSHRVSPLSLLVFRTRRKWRT